MTCRYYPRKQQVLLPAYIKGWFLFLKFTRGKAHLSSQQLLQYCFIFALVQLWSNSPRCFSTAFNNFMEKIILKIIRSFIFFGRNLLGCINNPYITYRNLSAGKTDIKQTVFIPMLVILYFIFVSTLRFGIRNPFFLTVKFNTLLFYSLFGFTMMLGLFYTGGRLVGSKCNIKKIYLLWVYTLIPTLFWFFATSVLYLILPPPRTLTFLGKFYSLVFIAFSIGVLFWKIILYYLTLRFSLKLDLTRIIQISTLVVPAVLVYSFIMYNLEIFRIPFL